MWNIMNTFFLRKFTIFIREFGVQLQFQVYDFFLEFFFCFVYTGIFYIIIMTFQFDLPFFLHKYMKHTSVLFIMLLVFPNQSTIGKLNLMRAKCCFSTRKALSLIPMNIYQLQTSGNGGALKIDLSPLPLVPFTNGARLQQKKNPCPCKKVSIAKKKVCIGEFMTWKLLISTTKSTSFKQVLNK